MSLAILDMLTNSGDRELFPKAARSRKGHNQRDGHPRHQLVNCAGVNSFSKLRGLKSSCMRRDHTEYCLGKCCASIVGTTRLLKLASFPFSNHAIQGLRLILIGTPANASLHYCHYLCTTSYMGDSQAKGRAHRPHTKSRGGCSRCKARKVKVSNQHVFSYGLHIFL